MVRGIAVTLALAALIGGCTGAEHGAAAGGSQPVPALPAPQPEAPTIIVYNLDPPKWTTSMVSVAYLLSHEPGEAGEVVTVYGDVSCSGHDDCRITDRPSCRRAGSPPPLALDTTKMPANVFDYSGTRKAFVTGEFSLAGVPHIVVSDVTYPRC